jgi:hypothetical protein
LLPPLALLVALGGLSNLSGGVAEAPVPAPQYNRDVRPILAENCFACHGPDKAARKASLRLDIREEAVKAGAISPGKPKESALVERINATEQKQMMPPVKSHKKLNLDQKKVLERWIAAGAEYQPHWSFIPPTRPALPAVKNTAWVRNPIDRFILANLEKHGLTPAPEADRRTLARRLSLDLTGLPPSPAEVDAFVKDSSPDAYEKYVDHLLSSPQWGEHRGRYWLDYARYADTHGIHFDNYREMWSYRDWVLRAFNTNMPFDQFTIEQIAGDLLPNRTLDQQVATGFTRCNITTNEGGAINEEYLVLYNRDRTETVGQVFLGLTVGCCVCHSHKFDPITQREFYQMAAFFNNTTQAAMDGNIKDTPPIITVPREEDRPRFQALSKEIAEASKQAEERKKAAQARFDKWLASAKADTVAARLPSAGLHLKASLSEGKGDTVEVQIDGKARHVAVPAGLVWKPGHVADKAFESKQGANVNLPDAGDFERTQAFSAGAWVKLPRNLASGAILGRMDEGAEHRGWDLWVQGNQFGTHIIHKWPDDALKVVTGTPIKANEWTHVFISYDGSSKVSGVQLYVNGVLQTNRRVEADSLKNSIRTKVPLKLAQRNNLSRINGLDLQDLRIYNRALSPAEVAQVAKGTRAAWVLAKAGDKRTPAEKAELFNWWLTGEDQEYQSVMAVVTHLQQEEAAIRARGTIAHVAAEKPEKPMAYVLFRGDYDKRREAVEPGTPAILPAMPASLPRNRLGFAEWLVQPNHPLTARVTVNRFWQEVFGTGIVRTAGDFGATGEPPIHPELLDWLAVEFRESGWNVKQFYKLLVTSATYRQSALATPEKREKDPSNALLSRGPRFRMDAEMIRDYALEASGLLVPRLGGPSVRPYQPEGVWEAVAMIGSNTRDYKRDDGNALYRRSMYTFWKRAAPPASMDIFNAPAREFCTVRRERTNTPLQALVTLNDPQFVEAARFLAQRALLEGGPTTQTRLDFLAQRILARPFRAEEMPVVQRVLDGLVGRYKDNPAEAQKLLNVGVAKAAATMEPETLAAWTMLVNTLLNLDETLNK